MCFNTKSVRDKRKDSGMNFGAIPNKFNKEYLKYVDTGYPFSTIKSKKLTALAVNAIKDKPNKTSKKVLIISYR